MKQAFDGIAHETCCASKAASSIAALTTFIAAASTARQLATAGIAHILGLCRQEQEAPSTVSTIRKTASTAVRKQVQPEPTV